MAAGGNIEFGEDGQVKLSGELTFASVPEVYRQLAARDEQWRNATRLNLAEVSRADSAGLALLLQWCAEAQHDGRHMSVSDIPDNLIRLAQLSGALEQLNPQPPGQEENEAIP